MRASAAAPPPPPPSPHAPGSIAAAKAALAPTRAPTDWLAPLPAAERAACVGTDAVRFPNGVLLRDVCERRSVHSLRAVDGSDLPTDRPAVFTGVTAHWDHGAAAWTADALVRRSVPSDVWGVDGGPPFACETLASAGVTMAAYAEYLLGGAARDLSPLYIFDDKFGTRRDAAGALFIDAMPLPAFFTADAPTATTDRPLPLRWLLVGAPGSGTPVHNHPATVAILVLMVGVKLWVALPPDAPLVDEGLSAGAWIAAHGGQPGAVVIVQREGETVFLPKGWYHCVLNVEPTTALSVSLYLLRDRED